VAEVVENGAGQKAGIKKGDVILKVAGIEVNSSSRLQEEVGKYRPGDKVMITIRRKSAELELEATLLNAEGKTKLEVAEADVTDSYQGMKMDNVTREEKLALGVKAGVKVSAMEKGLFKEAGIPVGFVITHINNEPVYSAKGAVSLMKSLSGAITIEGYTMDKKERVFAVKLPRKD
jgi:serine protease Do